MGLSSPLSPQNLAPKRSDIYAGMEAVVEEMVENGAECGVVMNLLLPRPPHVTLWAIQYEGVSKR